MNRRNIYYWLLLPVLALMMGACGESSNNEDPAKPDTPVTPVAEEDWQTVPASGGTIKKGDIALTFPAGTFSSDTKVAITEVEKGKMGGDLEASTFYQITMPATTAKPVTVKIKSTENGNDIGFVIRTTARVTSTLEEVQHDSYLETNYSGGEYSTTLPICDNGENPDNVSFVIGLGNMSDGTETKAMTRAFNRSIASGEYDGVKYKIYIGWGAWITNSSTTKEKLKKDFTPLLEECIKETIKQIHDLGFRLNGKDRTIPFYYTNTENWGEHEQDGLNNNFWSCVNLGISK